MYAVDNDVQAIAVTIDNSNRNHIGDHRITACLPEALPTLAVDVLLANILAAPLQQLAEQLANLVKPGGDLVLSGILAEQAPALTERYGRWFDMDAAVAEQGWVRLTGIRKS